MADNSIPQFEMIQQLRALCGRDPRLLAGLLYGSFAEGNGDRFSDIDCILYFPEETLPEIDPRQWAGQLAPLLAFYRNEFNHWAALYENLVRVEYHFNPSHQISELLQFRGTLHFSSRDSAILVDRTGELERCLESLATPLNSHDSMVDVLYLQDSLSNWSVFGSNVLARGELVRAGEILRLVQDNLLRLARLQDCQTSHWITPSRNAEQELSADALAYFQSCTSGTQRADLCRAYWNSWMWGESMLHSLALQFGGQLNDQLLQRVRQHLEMQVKPGIQPGDPGDLQAHAVSLSTIPGVHIRPARQPDLPAVLELIRLLEADGQVLDSDSAAQVFERFHAYPNYTLYVAELSGEVIGVFALLIMDNLAHLGAPSGILEDMVVKSTYQGLGVGRSMLAYVMQVCRSAGCYKLVLSSSLRRTEAHRFYQKFGLEQYGFCFRVNFGEMSNVRGNRDD